jgi:hypothetical protein
LSQRPGTKTLLEKRAAEEGRTVTNYLENLIVRNGKKSSEGVGLTPALSR